MSKILRLYNTFTRSINNVELGNKLISAQNDGKLVLASLYICGPTVYSDSHVGHALTYVRADLFRRFMKSLFNVRLVTVMNITDIDDKILARSLEEREAEENIEKEKSRISTELQMDAVPNTTTNPAHHIFNRISERYYRSFLEDMQFIRVIPADLNVKVTKQTHLIINYINKLEQNGHAYVADNGDIYFRVGSLKSYEGRLDERKRGSFDPAKKDPRDFVLWKAAKPNEPVWIYHSSVTGKSIPGRPGWHVQCSAISSAIFGNKLDFHYGGRDLIFPHHYNEEACCCAYHSLDTTKTIHAWSKNWLHSGHLIFRGEKMSKSLGNVIAIKNFIDNSSVNALRLLCVTTHYRSNVEFSDNLLNDIKSLDHKLSAFSSYLRNELDLMRNGSLTPLQDYEESSTNCNDVQVAIRQTHDDIIEGACDDFDLAKGFMSILELSKLIYGKGSGCVKPNDLVAAWHLLKDWCNVCGLEYGFIGSSHNELLVEIVQNYRQKIRLLALNEIKNKQSDESSKDLLLKSLLLECDKVRAQIDELGFVIRDGKI